MVKKHGMSVRCGAGMLALCVVAAGMSCTVEREAVVPEWEMTTLSHRVQPAFDLSFSVDAVAGGALRLVFGAVDYAEGSYLEIGPEGVFRGVRCDGVAAGRTLVSRECFAGLARRRLMYQQREHRWNLLADGRIVTGGGVPPEVGWVISFAARPDCPVTVKEVGFRTVQAAYFTDDFMRTENDPTSWDEMSGEWRLNTIRNPLLSANAFYYSGRGVEDKEGGKGVNAVALAGEHFWGDVEVKVACRPGAGGAVGVYLCYRGPTDYALFRWTANDSERPVRQLILREGGVERVLAESEGGYVGGQWHQVSVLVGAGWARVRVDGERVFLARAAGLTQGRIGLYVEGKEYASFDDVAVMSRPARYLAADGTYAGGWIMAGGEWAQVAPAEWDMAAWGGGMAVSAQERARLLWEGDGWSRTALSARLGAWRKGTLGLLFRYADERNYYCVRWRKASTPVLEVCRVWRGEMTVLATRTMAEDGRQHLLGVVNEEGAIGVTVDGRRVLEVADFAFLDGRLGLYAEQVEGGCFSEVVCEELPKRKPLGERTATAFAAEPAEMQSWAGAGSDWRAVTYSEGVPETVLLWWHQAEFRGDTRLDLRLQEPLAAAAGVGLLLDGDGKDVLRGYLVRLRRVEPAEGVDGQVVAELLVAGEVVGEKPLLWGAGPRVLSVRRQGETVSVFLSDQLLFSLPSASARGGNRIGWYANKLKLTCEDVDVYSENLVNYSFQTAPTDWRSGGGIWEVSNKWQCDPRWSFFSGRKLGGPAVIWFRRPLEGDFTIDGYIGNKMDRERGNLYEYARDMNISVCADGYDLTSGYSFLFGGHNNNRTSFYRKRVEQETSQMVINQRGLHRKWYHFRVSRVGGEVTVLVDGVQVFRKVDEEPLADGRLAVWTYDNGIMLGRVRISADGIGPLDSAEHLWPETTQAIYGK